MDSSSVAVNQVNVSVVPVQQHGEQNVGSIQQQAPTKLTPEQEEELKLRSKYPNPQKPGGSAFIQKMLHKGCKKYFDSGDYNMAKSKHKQALGGNRQIPGTANPLNQNVVEMSPSTEVPQGPNTPDVTPDTNAQQQQHHDSSSMVTNDHNTVNVSPNSTTAPAVSTPAVTLTNYPSNSNINPAAATASVATAGHTTAAHPVFITAPTSNVNTSPSNTMSPSVSSTFHSHLNPHAPHPQLSSSLSTSSVHMLASSISTDRLSNVQLNPSLLDDDEIGHAIPTPECLPQSRKHSIVQSKLATPTLSST